MPAAPTASFHTLRICYLLQGREGYPSHSLGAPREKAGGRVPVTQQPSPFLWAPLHTAITTQHCWWSPKNALCGSVCVFVNERCSSGSWLDFKERRLSRWCVIGFLQINTKGKAALWGKLNCSLTTSRAVQLGIVQHYVEHSCVCYFYTSLTQNS